MEFINNFNEKYSLIVSGATSGDVGTTKISFDTHKFVLFYLNTNDTLTIMSNGLTVMLYEKFTIVTHNNNNYKINLNRADIYNSFVKFYKTCMIETNTACECRMKYKNDLSDYKKIWSVGKIIALCGHAGSGKSTIADKIMSFCNVKTYQRSFAFKLKLLTSIAFEEPIEKYQYNKTEKPTGISFTRRQLLQNIANYFRSYDPDIFTRVLEDICSDYVYIVTDLRFLNEAQYIKSKGGVIIKVIDDKTSDINSPEVLIHEKEVDEIIPDFSINNTNKDSSIDNELISLLYDITVKY